MKREMLLRLLAEHWGELQKQFGLKSLALFGSAARGEAAESSDVDLLVEFDTHVTLFELVALEQYCEQLLGVRRVDIVMKDAILPAIRDEVLEDAIDVG